MIDIHTHHISSYKYPTIYNLRGCNSSDQWFGSRNLLLSIGIHPWDIERLMPAEISRISAVAADKKTVAIGECGLDKNINISLSAQKQIFETQIELSEQLYKPLIIHCVGRFNELMEMKKQLQPRQRWIVHGFRGKPQLASQLLNVGISLSFGEKFNRQSVAITPLEYLFTETDESCVDFRDILINISTIKRCNPEELQAGDVLFARHIQRLL